VIRALASLCYTFKTGPFKNALVKNGYDPRTDKDSIFFQFFVYQQNKGARQFKAVEIGEPSKTRGGVSEKKVSNIIQIVDCKDPSVKEYMTKYIKNSKQLSFDVR
jgi:hypothetical protein